MSDQSRRKLLKSIAAGSGAIVAGKSLPESWTKPVVDSVMLPAHAETSPATCEVEFRWEARTRGGEWSGDGGYAVFQPPGGAEIKGDANVELTIPGDTTRTVVLSPGEYSFSMSGGMRTRDNFFGQITLVVTCCNNNSDSYQLPVIDGPGGGSDDMDGLLTINEDGTCEVSFENER